MKKMMLNVVLGLLLASHLAGQEGETLVKIGSLNGALPKNWVINSVVNAKAKKEVKPVKEKDFWYLKANTYMHYFYNRIFPVSELDTIEVTAAGRGDKNLYIGYYIFDANHSHITWTGLKCPLGKEWKNFTFKAPVFLRKPRNAKEKQRYTANIRPLIWMEGKDVQFKDYTIKVIKNIPFKEWQLDPKVSTGFPTPGKDTLSLAGKLQYNSRKCFPVLPGDTLTFTMEVKGKGKLTAGYNLYRLRNNLKPRNARSLGGDKKEKALNNDSAWEKVTFSFKLAPLRKNGKTTAYSNGELFFQTQGNIELRNLSGKVVKEDLSMPEI